MVGRFGIWHFLKRVEKLLAAAALGSSGEIALIAPNAYRLRHGKADQLLHRNFLALGQFLGLLQDWLRYFSFDRRHNISRNLSSTWAGVTAWMPNLYPGRLGVPTNAIPSDAPPAFFVVANDDNSHVGPVISQLSLYRQANRPVEVHLYAHGGHGFNLGARSKLNSIKAWPQRMADWLGDNGFLGQP